MATKLASHVPKTASDDGVIDAARVALGDVLVDAKQHVDEVMLAVRRDSLVEACRLLRDSRPRISAAYGHCRG